MPAYQPLTFPNTRADAFQDARDWAPHAGYEYAKTRNFVEPGHANVSRLAPAVRVRLIQERELAQVALEQHGEISKCEKFAQECHWRSYWRTWLELRPAVWSDYQEQIEKQRSELAPVQIKRIAQIEAGGSGVGIMDAFARELTSTGYLHNHARMWFAAFWIHTERLPYQLGADFFERHLICACPASNTLSWRWVAGVQTKGKAYLARRSNLEKYCSEEYLEAGGLEALEKPKAAPFPDEPDYASQVPDFQTDFEGGGAGVWISEDDLSPETSALGELKPRAICTSVVGAPEKSEGSNGLRREFRLQAARDAGARAQEKWGVEAQHFEAREPEDLAPQMLDWARENKLQTVVALRPFVGPTADALPALQSALEEAKVSLQLLRRPADAALYPFADRGFFKFWSGVKKSGGVGTDPLIIA